MITLFGSLFVFIILGFVALIELFIEGLCILIGIPLFVIIGTISLFSWFWDKITHSFDNFQ